MTRVRENASAVSYFRICRTGDSGCVTHNCQASPPAGCLHQDGIPSDQAGTDAPRDWPVLLSLIDQAAGEQQAQSQHIANLASAVTRLVAQRLPVIAAPLPGDIELASEESAFADQMSSTVTTYLQQGFRRLLLVPWGGRPRMGSLLELARRTLSAATGKAVSLTEMTLPHVHVDGVSARGAFGGYVSAQAQLSPLMEAFPRWDRTWVRLSAGDVRIVFLRASESTVQPLRSAESEGPAIKALTAALDPQHVGFMTAGERERWQRDGELYARYLASLLCAATALLSAGTGGTPW
jgi:hypothetical protein